MTPAEVFAEYRATVDRVFWLDHAVADDELVADLADDWDDVTAVFGGDWVGTEPEGCGWPDDLPKGWVLCVSWPQPGRPGVRYLEWFHAPTPYEALAAAARRIIERGATDA